MAVEDSSTKLCSVCLGVFPKADFNKRAASPDGLQPLCRKCQARKHKDYAARHPEKNRAAVRRYAASKPEQRRQSSREYARRNKEKISAYRSMYRRQNEDKAFSSYRRYYALKPEIFNANVAKRRASQARAIPAWADHAKIREVYKEAKRLTLTTGVPHDVDHIVPLTSKIVCGLHVSANLEILPETENKSKGNRRWPDMP